MAESDSLGEVAGGLGHQADTFSNALLGSIHEQYRAGIQQAATKAAVAAVQLAEQATIIEQQAAEIERLQQLLVEPGEAIP